LLTPKTQALWDATQEEKALLPGFVLIGGTALSLHINHRISVDLDFAFIGSKLPRERIQRLIELLAEKGFQITPNDNPAALEDFSQGGEDLHDYHQDYVVDNEAKLTFVCPGSSTRQILGGNPTDPFRVATVDEIFKLKCHVVTQRNKSRDWFDLYTLFTQHGYTVDSLRETFDAMKQPYQADIALARLCSCTMNSHDEGYAQLLKNSPSTETMASYFRKELKKNEVSLARTVLQSSSKRAKTP